MALLAYHYDQIPAAFGAIFRSAFGGEAIVGGTVGTAVAKALGECAAVTGSDNVTVTMMKLQA